MRSIRSQLTLAFCLLAVVPLLAFGLLSYQTGVHELRHEYEAKLMAERDKRAALIESWLKERLSAAQVAGGSVAIIDYLTHPAPAKLATLRRRLASFANPASGYERMFVVAAGRVVASSRPSDEGKVVPHWLEGLLGRVAQGREGEVSLTDIPGQPLIAVAAPVRSPSGGPPVGAVVGEANPSKALAPILLSRGGLGATGEALLVDRQGMALTALRFRPGAAFRFQLSTEAARLAASGGSGLIRSTDYRGIPVVAAYTNIPLVDWGVVVKQDEAELEEAVRRLGWLLLVVVGLASAGAVVVATWLAGRMTGPLKGLARASKRLSQGERGVRVEPGGAEELATMGEAFNIMVETLQQSEETLQQANAELERLSRLRDEFLSMASHELKTPVTSIKLFAELVARHREKVDVDTLGVLLRQADQLTTLINDLLDVSRLQLGSMPMEMRPVDLAALTRETCRRRRALCDKDHTVPCSTSPEAIVVNGDPVRLEQVLTNLVDNAHKYAPSGSRIRVRACRKDGHALVVVQDEGPGIAPEHMPHIFERFYKPGPQQAVYSGLGVGLYISKEIVERHGGRIWAESEPGKGSRFYVELPLAG